MQFSYDNFSSFDISIFKYISPAAEIKIQFKELDHIFFVQALKAISQLQMRVSLDVGLIQKFSSILDLGNSLCCPENLTSLNAGLGLYESHFDWPVYRPKNLTFQIHNLPLLESVNITSVKGNGEQKRITVIPDWETLPSLKNLNIEIEGAIIKNQRQKFLLDQERMHCSAQERLLKRFLNTVQKEKEHNTND